MADGTTQGNSATESAGDVVARIEAFLGDRSRQTQPDLDGVMTKATAHLADLLSVDVIADDPICLSIVAALALADDREAFAVEIDRLLARAEVVLASGPTGKRPRRRTGSKPVLQVIVDAMQANKIPPAATRGSRVIVRL